MKKQIKSKKISVNKTDKPVVIVHYRRQRFLAFVALAGLFACGLFVGMALEKQNVPMQNNAIVGEASDEAQTQDVCIEVERLLLRRLPVVSDNVDDRIERAKIYVSLAERGCIENSDAYAEMARQELEIARAIDDDNFNLSLSLEYEL